jgi:citrate synthase
MNQEMYYPGLEGVVAGETAVSTIVDGLSYRGYSIEELADHGQFEEVAYLLLHGELPQPAALEAFRQRLGQAAALPAELVTTLGLLPAATSPMDVMRSGASLLAHWDNDAAHNDHPAALRKAERLLAQLPIVMAAFHRLRSGLPMVPARPDFSLAQNVLWMLSGTAPSSTAAHAMNVSLILYAEHEFNASTFTSRVVTSTMSDLHSAVTAAIGALKGPLHGGANERVLDVLTEVGSPQNAEAWVRDALDKKTRIMGFGHRVYKLGDPRAKYLSSLCRQLATRPEFQAMEEIASVIERIVVQEKGLPPNLDWPSARLYYYLGLPVDLYTPLFVVSRVAGWSAHVMEQSANNRIIRPRSRYIGVPRRRWVPLDER